MSVSSIGSSSALYTPTAKPQAQPPATADEIQRAKGETANGGSVAAVAPAPTVNLNGQSVGKLINVIA